MGSGFQGRSGGKKGIRGILDVIEGEDEEVTMRWFGLVQKRTGTEGCRGWRWQPGGLGEERRRGSWLA